MSATDFHTHLAPVLEPRSGFGPVGPAALLRPEALVAHLDRCGLEQAVVSPPPPYFRQDLTPADAAAWVTALNDGILAAVAGQPRLLPLAYLPLEHPGLAEAERRRRGHERAWAGFCASAGGRSTSLAAAALAPLWRALHDASALLLLHPGDSPDTRLEEFYLANLLGNPVETAVAAAQLVFGDVLPAHPDMRVMLVHCGGCVPDLVARWDHGVRTRRPGVPPLSEPPSRVVRRFYVDCLAHAPGAVDRAVDVFGEDRIVLGSDWPFPMGSEDPRALVAHRGEAFAERVAVENALSALRPADVRRAARA